jgi:uncharacterized tellurite resistance protein B-like protein
MRTYPLNSSLAAARVVCLALVADGQLQRHETAALRELQVAQRLGLSWAAFHDVLAGFCDDLMAQAAHDGDDCRLTPRLIRRVLADVSDAQLRLTVLELCTELMQSDEVLHDGETIVLRAFGECWDVGPWALPRTLRPLERSATDFARRLRYR